MTRPSTDRTAARPSCCAASASASRASSPTTTSTSTIRAGHGARHRGGERRGQVDADEDPLRRPEARRRHDRGRRRAGVDGLAGRRDPAGHRHGLPALHARRQPDRAGERRARRREAARHRRQGPRRDRRDLRAPTASGSTPTRSSRTSGSASGSGWRSSRCSTAARKVIILDEPTAVLVPQEVDALFANLRELKAQGHTLIFISHKLDEVLAVADDITVMRRGTTVAAVRPAEVTARKLAELMVGSELPSPSTAESTVTDEEMLELARRHAHRRGGGAGCSSDVSLRSTAARCSASPASRATARPSSPRRHGHAHPTSGRVELPAPTSPPGRTRARRESGIGYIPEDRQRHGLLLDSPLWENRILGHQTRSRRVKGALDRPRRRPQGQPADRRGVRRPHPVDRHHRAGAVRRQPAEVHRRPRDERRPGAAGRLAPDPRRRRRRPGGDLGPHPGRAAPKGLAVLLISADLDELIGLSDTSR